MLLRHGHAMQWSGRSFLSRIRCFSHSSIWLTPGYKSSLLKGARINTILPSDTEASGDILLGQSVLGKSSAGSDNRMRCTIFDINGNVKVMSGEFHRSELLTQHGLLPRDLRKINTSINSIVPAILVRENSVLINLLHIRALIKADMVILFDAYGSTDSKTQSMFMYDMTNKLKHDAKSMDSLPYEMRALEAVMISVVGALDAEMQVNRTVVSGVLGELEDDIDRRQLRNLLIQSKKLTAFHQKAALIRDALDELLEQQEDLAGMYLTRKLKGSPMTENDDHTEIEMLLESYYKHCDEIVQSAGSLLSNIRSTEEIINIILDSNRNRLMLLEIKFQIGTLAMGGGAFLSALYGMNLHNFIEESHFGFFAVSGFVFVFTIAIVVWGLRLLRKVQRVTMMSDEPRRRAQLPSAFDAPKVTQADGNESKATEYPFHHSMKKPFHSRAKHDHLRAWLRDH